MPNTLAHYGIQSLVSKTIFRAADIKWIGLGCLIPDLPWITQRIMLKLNVVDPVNLRLYVLIQASLFMCLVLSAAISLQIRQSKKIFLLLATNCLLHLLLDTTQIKWANGVHLLAPFSWQLSTAGFYWPEEFPTLLLVAAGLLLFPYFAWQDRKKTVVVVLQKKQLGAGAILLLIYLFLPCLLLNQPLQANNHFTAALKAENRTGLYLEIDRKPYLAEQKTIATISGEWLNTRGQHLPEKNCTLSIQGTFINHDTILISKYHVHSKLRDFSSIAGIIMLLISWLVALLDKRITMVKNDCVPLV